MGSAYNQRKFDLQIVDQEYLFNNFSCSSGCPVNTRAGEYVQAIAEGDFERAYAVARGPNVFASVCGRTCSHPCEQACRKGVVADRPISIRALKRYVTEKYGVEITRNLDKTLSFSTAAGSVNPTPNGHKVAIIGAGAAGVTCGHDLARLGYECHVYEKLQVPGGMLWVGIPEYRLPRELIKNEVAAVEHLGVKIHYGQECGKDFTLQGLFDDGFEAIFLGIGAHIGRDLPLPGRELKGIHVGVPFLRKAALYEPIEDMGERVLIIGGGNVAMDAARTAIRVKPDVKEVKITCLEARHKMLAFEWELEEALEEGATLFNSWGPLEFVGENGQLTGVKMKQISSIFDETGRFNPQYVEGSEQIFECDTCVITIGQGIDAGFLKQEDGVTVGPRGNIETDPKTMQTTHPKIFCGGDAAFGPRLVIDAVAEGSRAARGIDEMIQGRSRIIKLWTSSEVSNHHMSPIIDLDAKRSQDFAMAADYDYAPRIDPHTISLNDRQNWKEVERVYSEEQARQEGNRCLKCNFNTIFSSETCILCGGCIDVCPEQCLSIIDVNQIARGPAGSNMDLLLTHRYAGEALPDGAAIIKDDSRCVRCDLCVRRCPTDAITMEKFEEKEIALNV
jgi:NADPH-dependent glutamate synthase beta subunit-like oxidoreductase